MPESPDPLWRYGVALFPVPPLLSLVALGGLWTFVSLSTAGTATEADVLVGLVAFLLTVLTSWLAVLVAAVVAASVFVDARALDGRETWSPTGTSTAASGSSTSPAPNSWR